MLENLKQLFLTFKEKNETFIKKAEIFLNKESISISDLAIFIQLHPETAIKTKKLLGFTFKFYTLTNDNIQLYLEMKDEKILEMSVTINQDTLFQYRSYEDKYKTSDTIQLPTIVLET